jgi:predicted  nucleic acid-binding Zn-ribbon protein
MISLKELESECHRLQGELKSRDQKRTAMEKQLQMAEKIADSRLAEMRNEYEYKLKERSNLDDKFEEEKLKSLLKER